MNYRHAFHAGNFSDVFKHAVMAVLIEHLKQKNSPFCYMDTHAGIGQYDLMAIQAQKTGEYKDGIAQLLDAAEEVPALKPYLDAVRSLNTPDTLRYYPGSPKLARMLMRPTDRMVACELHPEDAQTLKSLFRGDRQVAIHHADGYKSLKAFLPPPERRGLVHIDPPYEDREEFVNLTRWLALTHKRWPTGMYLVWYPIKDRRPIKRFYEELVGSGMNRQLVCELNLNPDNTPDALNGSGLLIINPPFEADKKIRSILSTLEKVFDAKGKSRCEWLVGE
ncbi:MAG: 23S rRNA (adenine(2030)-N(6))-methyltransferase RlmJ [Proteobacteria bacterium]|nr:23S rRNA (adenine(2030)-N(6))-methyltransferase RlmJ [Pseudomonadota bacterium]